MTDFNENQTVQTATQAPQKRKQVYGLLILLGLITAHFGLVLFISGKDYLYNIWPQESYNRIYEQPWLSMNIRNLGFQTPGEFKAAQAQLKVEAQRGLEKNTPIPHFLLGELYNNLNQPQKAIPAYQTAIQQGEKDTLSAIRYRQFLDNAHAALAIIYYEDNNTAQAQQELAQITKTSQNREAYLLRAMKDTLDAPERGDFHLLLGEAFRSELKLGMASREIKQAEQLSQSPKLKQEAVNYLKTQMPNDVKDLSPLARYYGLAARSAQTVDENLPKAASLFEKSLKEDPQFDWSYNELAIIYRQLKDYPKATAYAQNAVARNANFYNPHLTLGDIALDQEHYPEAIAHFQSAKNILERLPLMGQESILANIENQIAYAYESLNNYPKASQSYQAALRLAAETDGNTDADYTYAQEGLARLSQLEKQEQAALTESAHQLSWKK